MSSSFWVRKFENCESSKNRYSDHMDRILNLSSDKREQNAREKEERLKEKENAEANGEPPAKKQKSEKRGQNKKRTHTENKVPVSVRYYGV